MKAGIEWEEVNFECLNQVQLAAAHGVSDKTVRRWQKDGKLPRNRDGTYSLPLTIQWRMHASYHPGAGVSMHRGARFSELRTDA